MRRGWPRQTPRSQMGRKVGADAGTAGWGEQGQVRRAGGPRGPGRSAKQPGRRGPGGWGAAPSPPPPAPPLFAGSGPRRPRLPLDPAAGRRPASPPGPASSRTHQLGALSAAPASRIPAAATAAPAPCSAASRPAAAEAAAAAAPAAGGRADPPSRAPSSASSTSSSRRAAALPRGGGAGRGRGEGREPGGGRTSLARSLPPSFAMAAAAPPSCGRRSRARALRATARAWRADRCGRITAPGYAPQEDNRRRAGDEARASTRPRSSVALPRALAGNGRGGHNVRASQ